MGVSAQNWTWVPLGILPDLYPVTSSSDMGDVVNLRAVRKRTARREQEQRAAQNRAKHGRTKAERAGEEARREHARRLLETHRIDGDDK
jgi:uncharacterized protein DUF4169